MAKSAHYSNFDFLLSSKLLQTYSKTDQPPSFQELVEEEFLYRVPDV